VDVIDGKRDLFAKADQRAWLFVGGMDQHRLFGREVVQVAAGAPGGVDEREQVLLEALIAELAG
jgi:hypothetical protein